MAAWLLGFSSAHTRRSYAGDMVTWLIFCSDHGIDPIAGVRRSHIDIWARQAEADGKATATIARRIAALASFYRYLVDEGGLASSPVEHVTRPHVGEETSTIGLDRDQLRRLLRAARETGSPRTIALVTLLAHNGLRIGEALAADIEDLHVERGHRVLALTRKGGRRGRTPLAPVTAEAIDACVGVRESGAIFVTKTGRRFTQSAAWKMLRSVARRANELTDVASRISPHSLRHSFITGALDAGVSLRDVQDAAGHADPRTTRRYDRGRHSLDRHATYAVTAWLDGGDAETTR